MLTHVQKQTVASMLAVNTLAPVREKLAAAGYSEAASFAERINVHYRKRDGFIPRAVICILNGKVNR